MNKLSYFLLLIFTLLTRSGSVALAVETDISLFMDPMYKVMYNVSTGSGCWWARRESNPHNRKVTAF